jgi:hypothetical protein
MDGRWAWWLDGTERIDGALMKAYHMGYHDDDYDDDYDLIVEARAEREWWKREQNEWQEAADSVDRENAAAINKEK